MADEFVGKDFAAQTFPYQGPAAFQNLAFSGSPWGQAIVNETWESQIIGAGDTGTINIDVQIPNDYVALLRTFVLSANDPSSINWTDGVVGLAYQQPGGPYKTTTAEMLEREYLWWDLIPSVSNNVRDRFGDGINYKNWGIAEGGNDRSSAQPLAALDNPSQIPLWLPPGEANLKDRAMIVYLKNDTGPSVGYQFRFQAVWDLYTLEQAYTSAVMSSPRIFS